MEKECAFCGTIFHIRPSRMTKRKHCSPQCYGSAKKITASGEGNNCWKGGIVFNSGYKMVTKKDHPRANKLGYVFEHILIAEEILGHALPKGACIHHKDRNRGNNKPENLFICPSLAYHRHLHGKENKLLRRQQ